MSQNLERFKKLLAEMFQLDQAELDFGIYRIMNAKREEIVRFLDRDLLPQVREAFQAYEAENRSAVEAELAEAVEKAKELGADPESLPRVKELRAKLAQAVDLTALENEVFSHLYNFFRRYYCEGDFISQRRYKEGVYAIPYEGEEVKLYWANHDQYYIKTSEYFRNYTFKLPSGKRVHFKLVEADTEKDNNRPQNGNERRFILSEKQPLAEENGELVIRFEYRPHPDKKKQAELNAEAVDYILNKTSRFDDWRRELASLRPTDKNPNRTLLEKHLTDYTARNTFDYFIHKDLGRFLRRELDFYIKNEVMHLDDIENETAPRVEQYLSKIKAIRRIAHKIIDFLAQIENFQKKLWLKKKFVVETQYCITLDRIFAIEDKKTRDWLVDRIIKNEAQREEWVRLFAIDELPDYPWRNPIPSLQRGEGQGEGHLFSLQRGEGQGEGHLSSKSRTKAERSELLKQFAREMRHAPTDAEQRLWYFLRDRRLGGYKFRRQHPVGNFIADFACIEGRLIVELDGGQHAELFQQEKDIVKTRFFEERGFRVVRFWNNDVLKDTQTVLETILRALEEAPHPNPLPCGERETQMELALPEGERETQMELALPEGERVRVSGTSPLPNAERETQMELALPEGERRFLKAHPTLVVDTRHFDEAFKLRLLAAIPDIDDETDGLLIHSENFQALNLLLERYRGQVECVHIDPPYNTATSGFLYKNDYQHSSWLAMMAERLVLAWDTLAEEGHLLIHIDENEYERLKILLDGLGFPDAGTVVWDKRNPMTARRGVATQHEYIVWRSSIKDSIYQKNTNIVEMLRTAQAIIEKHGEVTDDARREYAEWVRGNPKLSGGEKAYCYLDEYGRIYRPVSLRAPERRTNPKFFKPLIHPVTKKPCAVPPNGFSRTPETLKAMVERGEILFGPDETTQPQQKRLLTEESKMQVRSIIQDAKKGKDYLDVMGLDFPYCHPLSLYYELVAAATSDDSLVLDHFAGSGTTGHAVINLNREDGGQAQVHPRRDGRVLRHGAGAAHQEGHLHAGVEGRQAPKRIARRAAS
ncbi:MAG: hypothetical protein KatS3mg082_3014 [Nitrospiraceae bacterium]|nr:MAG: hypothetical protein KatS3mg082_3014 [Nitrospiraceae bacterium]